MLIYYEGYCIEIAKFGWGEGYYSDITLPNSNFHFWGYHCDYAENFVDCLKLSMSACHEITQDYGFKPDYLELDYSWMDCDPSDPKYF